MYRDGSRYPILSVDGKHTPFQDSKNRKFALRLPQTEAEGEKIRVHEVAGDEVIRMPDGRLTTVYHQLKRRELSRDETPKASEALLNQN